MLFTTLASVKEYISSKAATTSDDDKLTTLITSVSATFEKELNRHLLVKKRVELFDAVSWEYDLRIKGYPVHSITSIKQDKLRVFGSDITPFTNYVYDDDTHSIHIDDTINIVGRKVIQVDYVGGMALDVSQYTSYLDTPPSSPSTGDTHIVGLDPTGDWVGQSDKVATWDGSAWVFTLQDANFIANYPDIEQAVNSQVSLMSRQYKRENISYSQAKNHQVSYRDNIYTLAFKKALKQYRRYYD